MDDKSKVWGALLIISTLTLSSCFHPPKDEDFSGELKAQRYNMHWMLSKIVFEITQYLNTKKPTSIQDIVKDPQFRKLSRRRIGESGYSAIIDSEGRFIIHPDSNIEGKDIHTLPNQTAVKVVDASLPNKHVRGFYQWYSGEKYMAIAPIPYTFPDGKSISVYYAIESKDLEPRYREMLRYSIDYDNAIFEDKP